ncbi:hypothetical protein C8F04DRAFT_1274817 [Mycena alexandri]|uniref:Uncharacterized protein n=1 Tax=Mycena alexandri TaxID=1745969 RepID=A0AAD6S3L2_9AGAR|nr:hypothetical protein C8F04DRAFT_1274817 [Mycena alexandri]
MECEVDPLAAYDVVLGSEWASHIRDFVLGLGYRLNDNFDAWSFFSDVRHPLGFSSYSFPPPFSSHPLEATAAAASSGGPSTLSGRASAERRGVDYRYHSAGRLNGLSADNVVLSGNE